MPEPDCREPSGSTSPAATSCPWAHVSMSRAVANDIADIGPVIHGIRSAGSRVRRPSTVAPRSARHHASTSAPGMRSALARVIGCLGGGEVLEHARRAARRTPSGSVSAVVASSSLTRRGARSSRARPSRSPASACASPRRRGRRRPRRGRLPRPRGRRGGPVVDHAPKRYTPVNDANIRPDDLRTAGGVADARPGVRAAAPARAARRATSPTRSRCRTSTGAR